MGQSKDQSAVSGIKFSNLGALSDNLKGSVKAPASPAVPKALREAVLGEDAPVANDAKKRKKRPKAESREVLEQVNIWTSPTDKQKVKMACARDGYKLRDLLSEFLDLYEKKHGKL